MAAAILPIVGMAISLVEPFIPTLVTWAEGLLGHSSVTGSKDGAAKMTTVTSVLQAILTALANAGKIPSAGVVDPSLPKALQDAVQKAVDAMKTSGTLVATPPSIAPSTAVPATSTKTPAQSGGLADLLIYVANAMKGL